MVDLIGTKIKTENLEQTKVLLDFLKTLGWEMSYKKFYSCFYFFLYKNMDIKYTSTPRNEGLPYFERHRNKEVTLNELGLLEKVIKEW